MILSLTRVEVFTDVLEVMALKVAGRLGCKPTELRAKWGELDGTVVPMFTRVTEHGRIPPEEIYQMMPDLYAEMGAMVRGVLKGMGEKRGEKEEVDQIVRS